MSEPAARLDQSFYQRHEAVILGGVSILLILGLWEAAWNAKLISPLFFSGPSAIAKQMVYAWTRGHLKSDLVYSGTNFVLGFAAVCLPCRLSMNNPPTALVGFAAFLPPL